MPKKHQGKSTRTFPQCPASMPSPARQTKRLYGWRGWVLRILSVFLAPLLFLGLIEAGLRIAGYGYPTRFFIGIDGKDAYRTNERFGWRFFPVALARRPQQCILASKSPQAVRIFILGESAAQGIPDPAYSFGRILEVMLHERYPGVNFEIVNAAMTAINSHVVREIAKDCASQQPDLFIVYMGNNEVVGPYGPGTVFQAWSPSLTMIRGSVWIKSQRIGQLTDNVIGGGRREAGTPAQWRGMEMFTNNAVTADDPRLNSVYDNFRLNLADICQSARDGGVPVVLSTVVTNLRDCPPLASKHLANLSAAHLAQWEAAYEEGIRLEGAGKTHEAVLKFREAARLDDRYAELHFRLARCLAGEGNGAEAREHFVLARDLDALRFRADSRINGAIRQFAAENQSAAVRLVDAEQALSVESLSPDSVPGANLLYEHVHLTFEGNYQLALSMLDAVSATLPRLNSFRKETAVPTRRQCADALALTSWDELEMGRYMAEMTSRAPFTNQLDHGSRQAAVQENLISLGRIAQQPEAMQAGAKLYSAAIEKSPGDWQLRNHLASLALQAGQPAVAAEQCRLLMEKFPWEAGPRCTLGIALAKMGKPADAIAFYEEALRLNPGDSQTHSNLGNALRQLGRVPEAVVRYEQALRLNPDNTEAHNNFGNVLQQTGRISEAIEHYEAALRIRPDNADAHNNLANVLLDVGRIPEGIGHYRQALAIQPQNAAAHCNLGLALEQTGSRADAIVHYKEALRLNPNLAPARARLSALAGQELP